MGDASLLAYVDVTYVGTNMKMQLEKKKGSRLELLARKKGVRVVRDSLRKLYRDTLNRQ